MWQTCDTYRNNWSQTCVLQEVYGQTQWTAPAFVQEVCANDAHYATEWAWEKEKFRKKNMHFFWQKHFLVSIAVFFVSIAVNCTPFSEISTMPFIRGNARHAGRPPKCKVQISADNRGIKTKRILFLRGRRCNFWKVKAPFPAKLPMRCDSLRTVKAVQAPPHTVPLNKHASEDYKTEGKYLLKDRI